MSEISGTVGFGAQFQARIGIGTPLSENRPPTSRDLAKEAGVSMATVDRVLNNRPGVREPTRQKVEEAIKRLGYTRNAAASSMAKGRIRKYAVLLPDHAPEFAQRIEQIVQEVNSLIDRHVAQLYCVKVKPAMLDTVLRDLSVDQVDGAILYVDADARTLGQLCDLEEKGMRFVSLVQPDLDRFGVPVSEEQAQACGDFAAHMLRNLIRAGQDVITLVTPENPSLQELRCAHALEVSLGRSEADHSFVKKITVRDDSFQGLGPISDGMCILIGGASEIVTGACEQSDLRATKGLLISLAFNSSALAALSNGRIDGIICNDLHSQIIDALIRLSIAAVADHSILHRIAVGQSALWLA